MVKSIQNYIPYLNIKQTYRQILYILSFVFCHTSCLTPVDITNVEEQSLLVVEGLFTNEVATHTVRLTRSTALSELDTLPETQAQVWIEDDQGNTIPLTEKAPGVYQTVPNTSGRVGNVYQLNITTSDGKSYQSATETLKKVPPIDSIYAEYRMASPTGQAGLYIYLDTQDEQGMTRYYRWDFTQTYQIQVPYPSTYKWLGGNNFIFRDDNVGTCWKTDASRDILINNTINLEEDIVSRQLIKVIPDTSQEFRTRYSLEVSQYALQEDNYRSLNLINEINDGQGSLFATQPGIVTGNISALGDENEQVLGYFFVSQVQRKRAFFDPRDFEDAGYDPPPYFTECDRFFENVPPSNIGAFMETGNNQETKEIWAAFSGIFVVVPKACANCTGFATNEVPDFWK